MFKECSLTSFVIGYNWNNDEWLISNPQKLLQFVLYEIIKRLEFHLFIFIWIILNSLQSSWMAAFSHFCDILVWPLRVHDGLWWHFLSPKVVHFCQRSFGFQSCTSSFPETGCDIKAAVCTVWSTALISWKYVWLKDSLWKHDEKQIQTLKKISWKERFTAQSFSLKLSNTSNTNISQYQIVCSVHRLSWFSFLFFSFSLRFTFQIAMNVVHFAWTSCVNEVLILNWFIYSKLIYNLKKNIAINKTWNRTFLLLASIK